MANGTKHFMLFALINDFLSNIDLSKLPNNVLKLNTEPRIPY